MHGGAEQRPAARREPLTYYHPMARSASRSTWLMRRKPDRGWRSSGSGRERSRATGAPNETWTFYEIDPLIERIALDAEATSRTCATARRRSGSCSATRGCRSRRRPDSSYDFIVLDAFSSDAIPVHLHDARGAAALPAEARARRRRLRSTSATATSTSSRCSSSSRATRGWPASSAPTRPSRLADDVVQDELEVGRAVAVGAGSRAARRSQPGWRVLRPQADVGLWTDDFSNVFSVFRWR